MQNEERLKQFQEHIDEIRDCLREVQKPLRSLLDAAERGCFLPEEAGTDLAGHLDRFRTHYSALKEEYSSLTRKELTAGSLAEVEKAADEIRENGELIALCDRVSSSYRNLIAEGKEAAEELRKAKNDIEKLISGNLEEADVKKLGRYMELYEVMETIETALKEELFAKMHEFTDLLDPALLVYCLVTGKIRIGQEKASPESVPEPIAVKEPEITVQAKGEASPESPDAHEVQETQEAQEEQEVPDAAAEEKEDPAAAATTEIASEESSADETVPDAEEEPDSEEQEEENIGKTCLIMEDGFFDADLSGIQLSTSPKAGKYSISEFKKYVQQRRFGDTKHALSFIFDVLLMENYLAEDIFLSRFSEESDRKSTERELGYLYKEGYLTRAFITDLEKAVYIPTTKLEKLLMSQEIRKLLDMKKVLKEKRIGQGFSDDELKQHACLGYCMNVSEMNFAEVNGDGLDVTTSISAGFYSVLRGFKTGETPFLYTYGQFYRVENGGDMYETLDDHFKYVGEGGHKLLVCGWTMKHALNTLYAIRDFDAFLDEEDECYIYSCMEDRYMKADPFARTEPVEVDKTVIFKIPEDNDPDDGTAEKTEEEKAKPVQKEEKEPVKEAVKTVTEEPAPSEQKKKSAAAVHEVIPAREEAPVKTTGEETEKVRTTVYQLAASGHAYCASAILNKNYENRSIQQLKKLLAHAVRDPFYHIDYTMTELYQLLPDGNSLFEEYLFVSAALRTIFYDHSYEYGAVTFYDSTLKDLGVVAADPNLKALLYDIASFRENARSGMDAYADYRKLSKVAAEAALKQTQVEAKGYYEGLVLAKTTENANQRRFLETKQLIFARQGDIGQYLKAIIEGDVVVTPLMKDFLADFFMKPDSTVEYDNLDSEKVERYIDDAWNNATCNLLCVKRYDLVSSLRQNIRKSIEKCVKVLCEWVRLNEELDTGKTDYAESLYKQIKDRCLENINGSITRLAISASDSNEQAAAGSMILIDTLSEISSRLEGSYKENTHLHYYAEFLKTDDVMLDDGFTPMPFPDYDGIEGLSDIDRIKSHAAKVKPVYKDRLYQIFMEKGDDYGTAALIREVMGDAYDSIEGVENYDFKASIATAAAGAKRELESFTENVELAQSYGQIDASSDIGKDRILKIVGDAYETSLITNNFGFLRKVTAAFLEDIRKKSKVREDSLKVQLDQCRKQMAAAGNPEEMQEKIKTIEEVLDEQNYTVAEDYLSKFNSAEETAFNQNILPKDYLKEFLSNYDIYKVPVSDTSIPIKKLLNVQIHNKDDKGGSRIIDQWLDPGKRITGDQIYTLLTLLGFKVSTSDIVSTNGSTTVAEVYLKKPQFGGQLNYRHPIAAFGTEAEENGFKVVCLYGKTDADRLVATMKSMGSAKNCLFLVDYALSLPDRRKLARKVKEEAYQAVYAVIDRTMIHYIAKQYSAEIVNQMTISLVMPFTYYQPYVWDSSQVLPPEMFFGRDAEVEAIKSPSGPSLLFSGRQLGKSKIAQQARFLVNNNENGDRAVYIDIHNLDYKAACRKVSNVLFDEGVLESDLDTEDWRTLGRAIKQRLASNEKKIPYFLLLLDEADAFIESSAEVDYQPFDVLKDIQGIGQKRFKFVCAGLRNVVKFSTQAALGNNSVIAHLSALTLKPFDTRAARELLEIPLYYLGFRWPKGKNSMIPLILSQANYFPGLIQLSCSSLISAMREGSYAGYDQVSTPAYSVSESHLKRTLASEDFQNAVKEKYEITLRLAEDNWYFILALLMAYNYHQNGYREGYTAEDILNTAKDLEIEKIAGMNVKIVAALMDELTELNIFRKTEAGYLFLRYTFYSLLGNMNEIEDKLIDCMEV